MDNYLLTFAFGLLLLGGCSARVVTVSPGPLVRVEGQPVSIECSVTEYGGPREQDFDWDVSREANSAKIKMISTIDAGYSDPTLSKRIASGDISVVRTDDNRVELKIAEAKAQDAGFYLCRTPSTDVVISGNYQAQVQLTVIPNTLKVTPQKLPPSVKEGNPLTLSCNVTRELIHPTYLSVTWSVKKGATSEEILMFGPQGEVVPGAKFARLYADGALRLVPGRNGAFALVISKVLTSDEGIYECNGTEWTHESGGQWTKIVESTKELGSVSVIPTGQSLGAKASSSSPISSSLVIAPGDTITLLCSVDADNLASLTLEVAWLADGREIIAMDQRGVVVSNVTGAQEKRGKASLERTGSGEYTLGVRRASEFDGGLYTCRVRAFIDRGSWHMAAEKTSGPVTVKVSVIKPNFTPILEATQITNATGGFTELSCRVTNISLLPPKDQLGVSWEYIPLPVPSDTGAEPQSVLRIGSLDGNGNLLGEKVYADRLKRGLLSLTKVQPNTFKLLFIHSKDIDMGQYVCIVSSWSTNELGVTNITSERKSSALTVRWDTKTPLLSVTAKRTREASVGGATFEMSCTVAAENLDEAAYLVLIQKQEGSETAVKTIMTLSPDYIVQPGGATDPNRRDGLVLTKSSPTEFRFRLAGVQLSDRGNYWCDMTAYTKQQPGNVWIKSINSKSNKIKINFEENGPSFNIAIRSVTNSVYPWETAKLECSLSVSGSSPKTDDLAYEVRWFFTRLRGGHDAIRVGGIDRFGVVEKTNRNTSSDISIERGNTHTYVLYVFGTQDSDSGEYHCTATPWYLSASTGAWTEAGELTSGRASLAVKFAVWDSLKMPLLYGAIASIVVGIFSLILGVVCAHCCCRNLSHTPRTGNKLMDLEMD